MCQGRKGVHYQVLGRTETGPSGLGPGDVRKSGFDGVLGAETDWSEGKREGAGRGDRGERQRFVHSGRAGRRDKGQGLEAMSVRGGYI